MLIADSNRTGPVETIIRSARRRRACMLALEELGLALCLILAGVLLMLVFGAQVLRWYWLAILGMIGTGIAGYRAYVRRLSSYRIAQLIDTRLRLSDSLSTAWFLLSETPRRQDASARFQVVQAEQLAGGVNPAAIFHFRGGRAWTVAAALAAVALGLFAVRYLVTSSLSIQQAIVPFRLGEAIEQIETRLALPGLRNRQPDAEHSRRESPVASNQANKQPGVLAGDRNFESGRMDEAKMSSGANEAKMQSAESHDQPRAGQVQGQSGISPALQRPAETQSPQIGSQNSASRQIANTGDQSDSKDQNSSGLVDKLREALSSLMAKLHPNESDRNGNRGDQSASQDRKGDQASAARDRDGNLQQSARNNQASQQQNAEGAMRGRTAEKTQASQGQSSDEASGQKGAHSRSGIGHTNGDKGIKDAEQLKAMGKLAEIIGKRSANLTGDMTVETSSTNQQLRTQYSGRVGEHADLGGEINRDEVPVLYRDYVREYMQLVHKQAEQH